MRECAFCFTTKNLTKEHVISDWVNELFPGRNTVSYIDGKGVVRRWSEKTINWKARVVCGYCNNGWMSDLEGAVKPFLAPLIRGNTSMPITLEIAGSIAAFAFLKAVIVDHSQRSENPWFPREQRTAFREDRSISDHIQMWMCGVSGRRRAIDMHGGYFGGTLLASGNLYQSYVCTVAIGHLAFQLHSRKQSGTHKQIAPLPHFDAVAVPVWPAARDDLTWPFPAKLQGKSGFDAFSMRWKEIVEI